MSMTGGSVAVNQTDGTYTGSGLARALMDAYVAVLAAHFTGAQLAYVNPLNGVKVYAVGVANSAADVANALGPAIVAYVQANATANVATSLGGLQKSTSSGSLTDPIGGVIPVQLPIT